MNGLYIIIFFIIISIIKILLFDKKEENKIKINNEYLPPLRIIKYIWIFIVFILFYMYNQIDKVNKNNTLIKIIILLFITLCILYEEITQDKTARFFKNYNYFILAFFILLLCILSQKVDCKIYYIIPILLWFMYICVLTLLDDLNVIQLYYVDST
jgi:CDP-diglyceride synthetase